MVIAAASVVAIGLAYALLWLPMRNAVVRMNSELPQMRHQVAQMRAYADTLAVPVATMPTSIPKLADVRALAARAAIAPATVQGEAAEGDTLRVRIESVPGDALATLLDLAQHQNHWRPSDLQVARLAEPSRVRAEFTLTASTR